MTTVFLDRQHAGKPGRHIADRGAQADLDGDGEVKSHEKEAMLTPKYLLHAEESLVNSEHEVITLSDGWYSQRHARVNTYSRQLSGLKVYVAAHLNAGGGDYGAVFFDHRSPSGSALATKVALALKRACPELSGGVKVIAAKPEGWTKHAYNTIKGVSPVAICFEPCFIDNKSHHPLLSDTGLKRIGAALAEGISAWLTS